MKNFINEMLQKNNDLQITFYDENDVNCIIENLNEKLIQIYIEMSKNDYCERIENIDMILYFDGNAHENNVYIQLNIKYFNNRYKQIMHELKYYLIDCDCDICEINDFVIFERYIDLMIATKTCEICKIENINFNLIK